MAGNGQAQRQRGRVRSGSEDKKDIATLTLDKEDSLANGRVVIYKYSQD